jgi:hypothetical protein
MVDREVREAVREELASLVVPQQPDKGPMVDQGQWIPSTVAVAAVLVRQATPMAKKKVAMD